MSSNTPDIPTGLPTTPFDNTLFGTNHFRNQMPTALSKRNGRYGKLGKKAVIEINSHEVLEWPQKSVYQYDVSHSTLS